MILTEQDKATLLAIGVPADDFRQIQEAALSKHTRYELYKNGEDKGKRISRDEAIRLLGRKEWLSGLSRSAFHFSAVRLVENSDLFVLFDSRKYFAELFQTTKQEDY